VSVSASTQVAVLGSLREGATPTRHVARSHDRPLVRLAAFAALGFYGVERWGTLMTPAPTVRLLALLGLSLVLAGLGPVLRRHDRVGQLMGFRIGLVALIGVPIAVIAVLAAFPISGVPWHWVHHFRIAVTANGIGQGLSALPGVLVPYNGINDWVRVVMLLGAAVLLLDAGLLLAFAPPGLGDVRRAGAALPLIALVVVPATLVRPELPYLQGLLLFGLLALFMWGERVPADRRGPVLLACAVTGAAGMLLAPTIDQHQPWINYEALANRLAPAHVDTFNWSQTYGPLIWPRSGTDVLDVTATPKVWPGEYWKTEDLNAFDGTGWVAGDVGLGNDLSSVSAKTVAKYTQTLGVTIRAMRTTEVIAAGAASQPSHISQVVLAGTSQGTWTTETPLGPGDSYTVQVYAPHPSDAQLAAERPDYPTELQDIYLQLAMPQTSALTVPIQQVQFAAFGSRLAPQDQTDPVGFPGDTAVTESAYAPVYAIAQRLARGARTPYAYAKAVKNYLDSGQFTYNESPPVTQYPLVTFLTTDKIGYCQQFAGAMALLLRMGGVPARVATGFTTGIYDSATKQRVVTDTDAHAWVEVWFPHYGWVSFDPTPASAPARGGAPVQSFGALGQTGKGNKIIRRAETLGSTAPGVAAVHHGSSLAPVVLIVAGVLALIAVLAFVAWRRLAPPGPDELLTELERALKRTGRPVVAGVTLAGLERRFRTSPEAAGYVRAIRTARFGEGGGQPTLRQRRALRSQLRAGLGFAGALRALWALPPRPDRHPRNAPS
jgi:transglutaminase-like putative cysteine protease